MRIHTVFRVLLAIAISSKQALSACPRHDIETVYYGDGDVGKGSYHRVDSLVYAVDQTTLDIVVGGNFTPIDKQVTEKLFLYYIEDGRCKVPWHVFLDGGGSKGEWNSLAVRSESRKIYGLTQGVDPNTSSRSFVTIDMDWPNQRLEIKDFKISLGVYNIQAPRGTTATFMMGDNVLAWLRDTENNRQPLLTSFQNLRLTNNDFSVQGTALHVLKSNVDERTLSIVKIMALFSDADSDILSSISIPTSEEIPETGLTSTKISATQVLHNGSVLDSIAVCATFAETKMNFWSVVTSEDSAIITQYAILADQISSCQGINSISDGTSYVAVGTPAGQMYLLTVNILSQSNSLRVQKDSSIIPMINKSTSLIFLQQPGLEDQFFYGGTINIEPKTIGVITSSIDSRRADQGTFWNPSDESVVIPTFEPEIVFLDVIDEQSNTNVDQNIALKHTSVKPEDKNEFRFQSFDSDDAPLINDVKTEKSIMFNFAPYGTADVMPKRYVAPGMKLRQTLDLMVDPENIGMVVEVRDYENPFWNLWAVQLGSSHYNYTIYSDEIKLGSNAKLGKSDVIVSYKDQETGVRTNVTQPIEIVSEAVYQRYLKLNIIKPETNWVNAAKEEDQKIALAPEVIDWANLDLSELSEQDVAEFLGLEEGEELGFDLEELGEIDSIEDLGDLDLEELGLEDLAGELGDILDEIEGGGASSNKNSGGRSRGGGGSQGRTQTVCTDEVYYEDVEYDNTFVAVESEQQLIDLFLQGYGTAENYLRCYGGFVEPKKPKVDSKGSVAFIFSRSVVFPTSLLIEYDSEYVEQVPPLKPTEEELAEIRDVFEQAQEQQAQQGATSSTSVAKMRSVCEEVVIEDASSSGGQGNQGSNDDDEDRDEECDEESGECDYDLEEGDYEEEGQEDEGGDEGGDYDDEERRRLEEAENQQFVRSVDPSLSLKDRISVQVIAGKEDDEETAAETQRFTWQIENASPTALSIKFSFEFPESISTNKEFPTFVEVKAQFSDFEPGWIDDLVLFYQPMPAQKKVSVISESKAAALEQAKGAVSSAKQGTVVAMLTNIVTSGSMSQIWGMINGMQIFTHLPLFKVFFPAFAQQTIEQTVEISSFEIIPLGDIFFGIIGEPDDDGDDAIEVFSDAGFESYYMMINMGTLTVVFFLTIIIPIVTVLVLRPMKYRMNCARQKITSTTNSMRGNLLIRYVLEAALDLSISITLQIYYSDLNGGLFSSNEVFFVTNSILTILLGPAVIIAAVFLGVFYIKTFNQWNDEDYDEKYGAIFDGLRKDTKAALLYPLIFILRRMLFSIVAIYTLDYLIIQVCCLFVFSTIQLLYLVIVKPFEEPLMQQLEIFNEVCTLALVYVMICFSDWNLNIELTEHYYDIAFMMGMAINLLVHVYFLIKASCISVKDKIKNKCCKRKQVKKAVGKSKFVKPNELGVIQEEADLENQADEVVESALSLTLWGKVKNMLTSCCFKSEADRIKERKEQMAKLEEDIVLNRKRARTARARREALENCGKWQQDYLDPKPLKSQPEPEMVIEVKPSENRPSELLVNQKRLDIKQSAPATFPVVVATMQSDFSRQLITERTITPVPEAFSPELKMIDTTDKGTSKRRAANMGLAKGSARAGSKAKAQQIQSQLESAQILAKMSAINAIQLLSISEISLDDYQDAVQDLENGEERKK